MVSNASLKVAAAALVALVALTAASGATASASDGQYVTNCRIGDFNVTVPYGQPFGCSSYEAGAFYTFFVDLPVYPVNISFVNFSTTYLSDSLYIYVSDQTYGPFSGTPQTNYYYPPPYMVLPTDSENSTTLVVTFRASYSSSPPMGFVLELQSTPINLIDGDLQDYTFELSAPGFTYFQILNHLAGSQLSVTVNFTEFEGLQAPTVYLGNVGLLPTLTSYSAYQDATEATSGVYSATVQTSLNGINEFFFVGVFLYGPSATAVVQSQWTYNQPLAQNANYTGPGTAFSVNQNGETIFPVQLGPVKGVTASVLTVELSLARNTQAGLVAAVCRDFECLPGDSNCVAVLDTTSGTYQRTDLCALDCPPTSSASQFYIVTVVSNPTTQPANGVIRISWK